MTAMFRVRKAGIAGTSVALCCLSLIFVVEAKNGVAGKTEEWHEREFRLGLTGADYVVFALDGTGPLFVGTFVTKSEADAGRTVVYMFDQKGRPFRRVPFPEGYFAAAICPDRDKSLYGLCRDKEGDWRLVKLSLSGRVIWNNSVSQLDGKKALLVVSRDDWGKVCIAPSAKKGEFVVLWHSDGSRPEVGSLTFRGDTGKVGKALEGIMDAQGHRYLVEGNEVTVAKEKKSVFRRSGAMCQGELPQNDTSWPTHGWTQPNAGLMRSFDR